MNPDKFKSIGAFRIIRQDALKDLMSKADRYDELVDILNWSHESVPETLQSFMLRNFNKSRAQLQQDLLALFIADEPGFFVEFGATDGVLRSNTFLLESEFGWTGILAEPAKVWHENLKSNRSCAIDFRCVSGFSDEERTFIEVDGAEYSTLAEYVDSDNHGPDRINAKSYAVRTVSLMELLDSHSAPRFIEYLSIDTEGSEMEIISRFDFSKYKFGLISIEHNFSTNREVVCEILVENGYFRILQNVSQFDDWYIPIDSPIMKSFFSPI